MMMMMMMMMIIIIIVNNVTAKILFLLPDRHPYSINPVNFFAVYKGLVTLFSCSLQNTDNNPSVILFSVIALEKFAQTSKYMTSWVMLMTLRITVLWDVMSLIVMLETARLFQTSIHFFEISCYRILEDSILHVNTGVHKSQVPGHLSK